MALCADGSIDSKFGSYCPGPGTFSLCGAGTRATFDAKAALFIASQPLSVVMSCSRPVSVTCGLYAAGPGVFSPSFQLPRRKERMRSAVALKPTLPSWIACEKVFFAVITSER